MPLEFICVLADQLMSTANCRYDATSTLELGRWTRTEHVVYACPTLRERNEREGRLGFQILY